MRQPCGANLQHVLELPAKPASGWKAHAYADVPRWDARFISAAAEVRVLSSALECRLTVRTMAFEAIYSGSNPGAPTNPSLGPRWAACFGSKTSAEFDSRDSDPACYSDSMSVQRALDTAAIAAVFTGGVALFWVLAIVWLFSTAG